MWLDLQLGKCGIAKWDRIFDSISEETGFSRPAISSQPLFLIEQWLSFCWICQFVSPSFLPFLFSSQLHQESPNQSFFAEKWTIFFRCCKNVELNFIWCCAKKRKMKIKNENFHFLTFFIHWKFFSAGRRTCSEIWRVQLPMRRCCRCCRSSKAEKCLKIKVTIFPWGIFFQSEQKQFQAVSNFFPPREQ